MCKELIFISLLLLGGFSILGCGSNRQPKPIAKDPETVSVSSSPKVGCLEVESLAEASADTRIKEEMKIRLDEFYKVLINSSDTNTQVDAAKTFGDFLDSNYVVDSAYRDAYFRLVTFWWGQGPESAESSMFHYSKHVALTPNDFLKVRNLLASDKVDRPSWADEVLALNPYL